MRFRLATVSDVFPVISLFQKSGMRLSGDALFSDYKKLEAAILNPDNVWIITEVEGAPKAVLSVLIEHNEGIAKVTRMFGDMDRSDFENIQRETLRYAMHYLAESHHNIEMIYSSTMSMTLEQQELTLNEGFKILGIFPNALGEDNSMLNGLTGYYFKKILSEKRIAQFTLHPTIEPFFRISQRHYNLPDLKISSPSEIEKLVHKYQDSTLETKLPELEMIRAEKWVGHRFQALRSRHSQVINFYPFYNPNAVVTSVEGDVEIFVRISPATGFCAVIGERMTRAVDPVGMYKQVLTLLREHGVTYVEIINDAADLFGTECILKSGFTPCAYVPAFKKQGQKRRDYVVFGKSFEYLCRPDLNSHRQYLEFYREYFKIEGRNYFPDFILQ